jgi:hypothetical protein
MPHLILEYFNNLPDPPAIIRCSLQNCMQHLNNLVCFSSPR